MPSKSEITLLPPRALGIRGLRRFAVALLVSAVAGCSTTPDPQEKQTPVDEQLIDAKELVWRNDAAPTLARVRIARDSGMIGGACPLVVYVNNQAVVKLFPGNFVELGLPTGSHDVFATHGGILCPPRTSNQLRFNTSAAAPTTVRLGIRDTFPVIWSAE
jgi:hypothetical protein